MVIIFMNKQELVSKVAKEVGITQKSTQEVIDATVDTIMETVKKGDKVTLVGFGTFTFIQRKARKGRNPQTGKPMNVPARKSPKFSPGKEFRQRVNN